MVMILITDGTACAGVIQTRRLGVSVTQMAQCVKKMEKRTTGVHARVVSGPGELRQFIAVAAQCDYPAPVVSQGVMYQRCAACGEGGM